MPRRLIEHFGESNAFVLSVPDNLDYWTRDGKRVNFRAKRMSNSTAPEWTGFNFIVWIFNLYIAWKKRDV